MMKRKGFILAEILTGLMIQAWFIVTLCGAFYLLLTFSNRIQQSNAAQDHGQRVIAYVDARIRNAGLGLWGCVDDVGNVTPGSIFTTLNTVGGLTNMPKLQNLHLPVAITSRDVDKFGPYAVPADGIYSGDVLTLLYAHRDFNAAKKNNSKLVISLDAGVPSQDIPNISNGMDFILIGGAGVGYNTFNDSSFARDGKNTNIRNYAVMERSGVPVMLRPRGSNTKSLKIVPPSTPSPTRIYNMSELLMLECERMYVAESTGQRSFMVKSLGDDASGNAWNPATPHTAGVLELYMELDTNPIVPIFTLKVLVSEGKSDSSTPTPKPADWPQKYWKPEFATHNVHISQASWRLPNLAPIDYR